MSKMKKKQVRERQFTQAQAEIRDLVTFKHINELFENGFEDCDSDHGKKINIIDEDKMA